MVVCKQVIVLPDSYMELIDLENGQKVINYRLIEECSHLMSGLFPLLFKTLSNTLLFKTILIGHIYSVQDLSLLFYKFYYLSESEAFQSYTTQIQKSELDYWDINKQTNKQNICSRYVRIRELKLSSSQY